MHALKHSMIVMLGAGLVRACGGGGDGGGDGSPSTREPLALNASNGRRVSQDVVEGSQSFTGGGGVVVASASAKPETVTPFELRAMTYSLALEQLESNHSAHDVTVAAQTVDCPDGGTISVDNSDANGNGQADAGDSASITYNNCKTGDTAQNGTLAFNVISVEGTPNSASEDWAFTFGFRFDDFSVRSNGEYFAIDGDYTLAASYKVSTGVYQFATAGSEVAFTDGADTAKLIAFDFLESLVSATSRYAYKSDFVLDASNFAGSVTVVTNAPFRGVDGFPPASGRLTITGANNTRIVVQAIGEGMARISIDANGDGDFTDSVDRVIEDQWTALFD